ncbi:MAG: hypothetical protein ACHQQQ_08270 [Bacteroidota bacterium]
MINIHDKPKCYRQKNGMTQSQSERRIFSAGLLIQILILLFLSGCGAPPEIQKKEPPPPEPKPVVKKGPVMDNIIRIGSLDLSTPRNFKIEQPHIDQIASIIAKDSLDVFTIQSVTRYPGLTSRIDIVDALTAGTGMGNIFGENITTSGRQMGNVVFSRYPAISHENTPYNKIQSLDFESALQAEIDLGTRQVVVVSTEIPRKAPPADIMICMTTLGGFRSFYNNEPVIFTGNLPYDASQRRYISCEEANIPPAAFTPRIWYATERTTMKLLRSKTVQTMVGVMSIAEFGLMRKQ